MVICPRCEVLMVKVQMPCGKHVVGSASCCRSSLSQYQHSSSRCGMVICPSTSMTFKGRDNSRLAGGAGCCRLEDANCAVAIASRGSGDHKNLSLEAAAAPSGDSIRKLELTRESATRIQLILEEDLLRRECVISTDHRRRGFVRARPTSCYHIDKTACESLSRIIRTEKMSVEEAAQFVRGESGRDERPNKALDPARLQQVLKGYPHLDLLVKIAEHGIEAQWTAGPTPRRPPIKNHGSCQRYLRAVTKSIRDGQDSGQYLVVEADILDLWPKVICSPLGAVEKKGADPNDEVRTIHDLSYPENDSVNSAFIPESIPQLRYGSVVIIAGRIEDLVQGGHSGRIKMLKGDVKTAFRHLHTRSNQVFRMAAFIKELGILIIDLAAPFGWSGSPPCYSLFGRAISWLMNANSPSSVSTSTDTDPFFPFEWVDDHILVEPDVDNRLELAEATLRHAMLAVLGPRSINEAKFSEWSDELVALGLLWNTSRRTVSIPPEKITKARNRVSGMLQRGCASKSEFYQVLGSLRHVATCLRSAKPFYQRLQSQCTAAPRFGRTNLSAGSKQDLTWFQQILNVGCLAELPLALFCDRLQPRVHLYMDASNAGLAVLDPATNEFVQVKFDADELQLIDQPASAGPEFSINVREHLCIAFALWTWGPKWNWHASGELVHVKCWSDNSAAVSWCTKLHSGNLFSQEINRCIGLAEAQFNIRVSASHIAGSTNLMADAASRAWTEPYRSQWTNFSSCWTQIAVPPNCRKLYREFSNSFNPNRWPRRRSKSMGSRGGATALFNAGFDSLAVKMFGRWRSDAVESYTKIGGRLTSRMAKDMVSKPALLRM